MHYNKAFYNHADCEMRDQVLAMPKRFNSVEFCTQFSNNYPSEYEWLVLRYRRKWDRAHAVQIANREITHTLRNKYADLVKKIGEAPNPHGGSMSLWQRV
jgi:hypothetical protein